MPRAHPLRPVVPAWDDTYPEMADPRGDDWAASTVDVAHRIWDRAVGGPSFRAQAKRCVRRIDRWKGALRRVEELVGAGYLFVVDADLKSYFDQAS